MQAYNGKYLSYLQLFPPDNYRRYASRFDLYVLIYPSRCFLEHSLKDLPFGTAHLRAFNGFARVALHC